MTAESKLAIARAALEEIAHPRRASVTIRPPVKTNQRRDDVSDRVRAIVEKPEHVRVALEALEQLD